MSGIAQVLLAKGVRVSGSDIKESALLERLAKLGAQIYLGHKKSNITTQDLIVYSSAIKSDNPELIEARQRGITTIKRAQALAELMEEKTMVTVSGAHGKTTTAGLISHVLLKAGLNPTSIVGGVSRNWESNACLGEGKFLVIEADESDGSFLYYRPEYSLITNIDYEHMDYYKDFSCLLDTFSKFVAKTKKNGCLFGCSQDPNLSSILEKSGRRYVLFGMERGPEVYPAHIELKGLGSEFDCIYKGRSLGRFKLIIAGEHNILNSLGVIALAMELKIDLTCLRHALATYLGTERRLELKFQGEDILLLDDYAHHPTEIKATLRVLSRLGRRRLIAIFQPHRYTRTQSLLSEFKGCFDGVDELIITDIYPAGEQPIAGVSAEKLYQGLKQRGGFKLEYLEKTQISRHILSRVKAGDTIVTLGAGDIGRIADELAQGLKRKD